MLLRLSSCLASHVRTARRRRRRRRKKHSRDNQEQRDMKAGRYSRELKGPYSLVHLFSRNSLLLEVLNSFLRCVHVTAGVRPGPFSAGHAAFLLICFPADVFTFGTCPAGVRTFPLAAQHFCPFVFQLTSLLLSPRFGARTAGVRPFLLATQHFYSFVAHVISLLLSPRVVSLLVSLLVGHCVRLVSLLSPLVSGLVFLLVGDCVRLVSCFTSVSFCLPSCFPSCWSCCPSCLPSVSFCLPFCLPSCRSLCLSCLTSVSLLVSLLVGHCVRLASLLLLNFTSQATACN